jgi:hypothetical protein
MTFADNETQASETKCDEACWTNYTRHVVLGKMSETKFEA